MKIRIIIGLLIATIGFSQSGCALKSDAAQTSEKEGDVAQTSVKEMYNDDIYEFIDPDTGVHYLVYSHYNGGNAGMGGITPRLNSDGTIMVD